MDKTTLVSELTVEELLNLIEVAVRHVLAEKTASLPAKTRLPLELPVIHVDAFPEDITFSRSEIYGDDGR